MKYILYCRKSSESEDRQIMSIEAQEREMLEVAKRDNLSVVKILKEKQSAKDIGRPVFNEMVKLLQSGKADGILSWKLDRLARNFIDGGAIIDMLQKGVIQRIKTYDRVCLPSDNVLMLAVEFGMANQYVRDLSVNVKRGNREKLARGEWPNRAPFGYVNDKVNKTIILDEKNNAYIERMFRLYATGAYSYQKLSDMLYREGMRMSSGKKMFKSHMKKVISNPFYCGIMVREGKYYDGKHEPIISKDLFDKAQEVSALASRPRPKTHFFPLRGFLSCGNCGCALTTALKKGHQYYYCTNGKQKCDEHKSYMRETYLYGKIAEMFTLLHFDEEFIELMYESAKERTLTNEGYAENVLSSLSQGLETLKVKESRLLDSYLAEQVPQELYEAKMREISNDRVVVKKQIAEAEKKHPHRVSTLEPTKKIFLESSRAMKDFLEGDDAKKHDIVKKLLWNLSFRDKNMAQYQFKSPYDVIAKAPKNADISTMWAVEDLNL